MYEFLESLEQLKELPIVRFFSQFFVEDRLAPLFARFQNGLSRSSPSALAKELLVWAIVLALVVFAVDQVFFWTKPGQIQRARATWKSIASFFVRISRNARSLALRAKNGFERRLSFRGRR